MSVLLSSYLIDLAANNEKCLIIRTASGEYSIEMDDEEGTYVVGDVDCLNEPRYFNTAQEVEYEFGLVESVTEI
jgi:hypothetical protein